MTDNEIIKALELCINNDILEKNCDICPYRQKCAMCMDDLMKDTLALINRQQAEIERLRKDNGIVDILYQEEQAQNEDLKTKIERLKKGWKADVIETQNIKAEAIKELIAKLEIDHTFEIQRDDGYWEKVVRLESIKAIVKEMVGEE